MGSPPAAPEAARHDLAARWTGGEPENGIETHQLSSWDHFHDFLQQVIYVAPESASHQLIWRGQRRSDWSLSSSLDRVLQRAGLLDRQPNELEARAREHLERFKYATRGRRGITPAKLVEDEWWALGQHYGLATPLLDWSLSPFAAAYFAFEESAGDSTPNRVVYGLDRAVVRARSKQIEEEFSRQEALGRISGRTPVIEFVDPLLDENPRLVSQAGLFTRAPIGVPIDDWVYSQFQEQSIRVLLRVEIPNADRELCLRSLDRMNINHLSLFPDLNGASRYANLKLELGS